MSDPRRILLVTFGTRGDVQPFCVLGRELQSRGHAVRVATTPDYANLVRRSGLELAAVGRPFADIVGEPRFEPLFSDYFSAPWRNLPLLRGLARAIGAHVSELLTACADEMTGVDLVVCNPFAFVLREVARQAGIPAIGVMCQPLRPTREMPLALLGCGDLGRLGNRLSYETMRPVAWLLRRSLATTRRRAGRRRLPSFLNPLTIGEEAGPTIMAYSRAVSPIPADWPADTPVTGFWFQPPNPDAMLPDEVLRFLAEGPPPVYVGFGSMQWGARRNSSTILRALALWGGRAIVSTGGGGLKVEGDRPAAILTVGGIDHASLFGRVAATLHHGGAGTSAAALRAGTPSIVLPMLGDQLYWGRRLAAIGAADPPRRLGEITAEELAASLDRICGEARYRAAAERTGAVLRGEPGVAAAADIVDRLLDTR